MAYIEAVLVEALTNLVKIADEMIPAPSSGLSNWQLNEAEKAIRAAYKVLEDAKADEAGA